MYQNKEDLGTDDPRILAPVPEQKLPARGKHPGRWERRPHLYGKWYGGTILQAILFETTDSVVSVTVDYRDDSQREAYQEDVDGFLESIQIPEQPETQHMVSARIKM